MTSARWKKIAERLLTGNPMVDAALIDDLRRALLQACEENEQLEEKLATVQAQKTYWESMAKPSERKTEGR